MSIFSRQEDSARRDAARDFCRRFKAGEARPRYVLGVNSFAESIAAALPVDGFIDDFSAPYQVDGKPVVRTTDVPPDAMVVSAVLGRVWTAQRRLQAAGLETLDYYAFHRHAGLDVANPFFWTSFEAEFDDNVAAYEALHARLADETSRKTLRDVVNFRLTADIDFLHDYVDRQSEQYFEAFLDLAAKGEVFLDVGGFDGLTSEVFIGRCPDYAGVHLFEPEPANMALAAARLTGRRNIALHELGASDRAETLRLTREGSTSHVSQSGEVSIRLDRLDAVVEGPVTFIKMDIEGAERAAIDGAAGLIRTFAPRLAIAAYHRVDDFRRLPEQVLALHADYELYLRHYTEGRDETVMFFIPRTSST